MKFKKNVMDENDNARNIEYDCGNSCLAKWNMITADGPDNVNIVFSIPI